MSGANPDAQAQWEEARRWFAIAEEDLRVAGLCLNADLPSLGAAAHHCQQAAEKLIKGLLVAAALRFGMVHDLDELADQAAKKYDGLAAHLDFCRPLTRWGTLFRYPTLGDEAEIRPSEAEISEAVVRLTNLRDAIRYLDPSEA